MKIQPQPYIAKVDYQGVIIEEYSQVKHVTPLIGKSILDRINLPSQEKTILTWLPLQPHIWSITIVSTTGGYWLLGQPMNQNNDNDKEFYLNSNKKDLNLEQWLDYVLQELTSRFNYENLTFISNSNYLGYDICLGNEDIFFNQDYWLNYIQQVTTSLNLMNLKIEPWVWTDGYCSQLEYYIWPEENMFDLNKLKREHVAVRIEPLWLDGNLPLGWLIATSSKPVYLTVNDNKQFLKALNHFQQHLLTWLDNQAENKIRDYQNYWFENDNWPGLEELVRGSIAQDLGLTNIIIEDENCFHQTQPDWPEELKIIDLITAQPWSTGYTIIDDQTHYTLKWFYKGLAITWMRLNRPFILTGTEPKAKQWLIFQQYIWTVYQHWQDLEDMVIIFDNQEKNQKKKVNSVLSFIEHKLKNQFNF